MEREANPHNRLNENSSAKISSDSREHTPATVDVVYFDASLCINNAEEGINHKVLFVVNKTFLRICMYADDRDKNSQ